MTTFEDAKVGDRVFHYKYGWKTISHIKEESSYPIIIDYDFSYTYNGFAEKTDSNPSIFWDEVKIVPPSKPLHKLEIDTKVLVWDSGKKVKLHRHFSHFEKNGKIVTFAEGRTSWSQGDKSVIEWENWELPKDNQCQDS